MMLRVALAISLLALNAPPIPADYTECKAIHNGPITPTKPVSPFQRKPDFAATTEYPRTLSFDGMPPRRFRAPLRMTVETGSVAKCGKAPRDLVIEACTLGTTVHLPNPCDYGGGEEFARLFCHEQAHVQGWSVDHGP